MGEGGRGPARGRMRENLAVLPVNWQCWRARPSSVRCAASFSLRAKSRLRRLRSDTRLRAQTEFLYLFSQSGSDSKEMQHLNEYYKGKNKQYAVNTQKENDDGLYAEFLQDSDFSTLEYTIPFQMLFVKASRERGIDLNIPKDPQFHHYMGSKIGQ